MAEHSPEAQNTSEPLPQTQSTNPTKPRPTKQICPTCDSELDWFWVPGIPNPVATGAFLSFTDRWELSQCPDCEEQESKRREEERKRAEDIAKQSTETLRLKRLEAVFQGPRGLDFTFESFKPTPQNARALALAKQVSRLHENLFLFGPCGTGKTHLAGAAFREHFLENGTGQFWKPPKLLRYMRVLESEIQEQRIQEAVDAPILVLDDLGIGNPTEFYHQVLNEIIDGRWMKKSGGLFITSNLSLQQLYAYLEDDRLTSRLAGMCQVCELKASDHRLKSNGA